MLQKNETISLTKVVEVLRGNRYFGGDPSAAHAGTKEHTLILNAITEYVNPTMFGSVTPTALPIKSGQILARNKPMTITINSNLYMNLKPDMILSSVGTTTCIEIKKSYNEFDLLQLLFGCIAASKFGGQLIAGILYLYGGTHTTRTLRNGGREYWDDAMKIAELAARMLDTLRPKGEQKIKNSVMYVDDLPTGNRKEHAVLIRNEMDNLWSVMAHGLTAMLN